MCNKVFPCGKFLVVKAMPLFTEAFRTWDPFINKIEWALTTPPPLQKSNAKSTYFHGHKHKCM